MPKVQGGHAESEEGTERPRPASSLLLTFFCVVEPRLLRYLRRAPDATTRAASLKDHNQERTKNAKYKKHKGAKSPVRSATIPLGQRSEHGKHSELRQSWREERRSHIGTR